VEAARTRVRVSWGRKPARREVKNQGGRHVLVVPVFFFFLKEGSCPCCAVDPDPRLQPVVLYYMSRSRAHVVDWYCSLSCGFHPELAIGVRGTTRPALVSASCLVWPPKGNCLIWFASGKFHLG
jgi:hypothetical protein